MADYFIDTELATGNDDGSTFDDAYQDMETALEYDSYSDGDNIWIRRRSGVESPTDEILINSNSTAGITNWIHCIGWPREENSGVATFINGSTEISSVTEITPNWEQHVSRRIKNNSDDKWYLITNTSGTIFIIDREFAGSDDASVNFTIEEDERYTQAQAIDDSTWTIKKTDWNADDDSPPLFDFGSTDHYMRIAAAYMWRFLSLHFKGGNNSTYNQFGIGSPSNIAFKNCLFEQSNSRACIFISSTQLRLFLDQCIFRGSSPVSGTQTAIYATRNGLIVMNDCAVYGMRAGLTIDGYVSNLNNVNVGVEIENTGYDIVLGCQDLYWKDVKLGAGSIEIIDGIYYRGSINIENYNKELGINKSFNCNGNLINVLVVEGSGDPEKRSGGADEILAIRQNQSASSSSTLFIGSMLEVFEHRYWADTSSRNYRYYVQADSMTITDSSEFFIEVEYTDQHENSIEYYQTKVRSDETITVRSGAADWSQYIEVTGIQPATTSWVIIRCYMGFYDADGVLYLDPMAVLS
ncbi:MAG: hypothetical protein GY853_09870 [PVC group bacterium]|nr:hypothetical protein [PVC group bacterium]